MSSVIRVEEFSKFPGGRFISDGPYSGEEFRTKKLFPALSSGRTTVILDGVRGYPASFLEEAFGGLIRECGYTLPKLAENLSVATTARHLQRYIPLIWQYIEEAEAVKMSGK